MRLLVLVTIVLWMAAAPALSAPMGTAFTYQGRLTNSAGSPLSGSYDLVFKLYDALTAGSQIGSTVTLTGVSAVGGLFTVQLDFGAAPFNGQRLWLETSVQGAALVPRTELTPAPYALFAPSVSSVPLVLSHRAVSSDTTASASDTLIGVDVTSQSVTITLPLASSVPAGKVLVIAHESGDAATNGIRIVCQGNDFINTSQTSLMITFGNGGGAAYRLYSDGVSRWRQW